MISRRSLLVAATVAPLARAQTARAESVADGAAAPVLYVSHGAPLFVVNDPVRFAELHAWGTRLARPRGIVVVTPHFASRDLLLGSTGPGVAMRNLPEAAARAVPASLTYPTPPSHALATRVGALLAPLGPVRRVGADDRPGFDHTTWMPLLCLFPAASVPVLEIAYPYRTEAQLFALGQRLAPLRDEGVAFVASGGMTHNLASASLEGTASRVPSWSKEFDGWAAEAIAELNVDTLLDWRAKAPANALAHPDDGAHFRTVLVALGVALGARAPARRVAFPVIGFESTLSKRCVELA
jgi:4,5-DOPA dioxygenase extradiol